MADTIQCVSYALEHTCPLRTGDAIANAVPAIIATEHAQNFAASLNNPDRRFGIFGDVRVTGYTFARSLPRRSPTPQPNPIPRTFIDYLLGTGKPTPPDPGPTFFLPSSGYVISNQFKDLGGPQALKAMCKNCPVNATAPSPAGCAGWLGPLPNDPELESRLTSNIARLGLESQVAKHFLVTRPLWYGLWTKSPLSPEAAGLLLKIMTPPDHPHPDPAQWLAQPHLARGPFLVALHLAHTTGARLHVRMAPPGHTDCGRITTFAHCPTCKAEITPRSWDPDSMPASYNCKICAATFSPAQQFADEPDLDDSHTPDPLPEALGEERYKQLILEYLAAQNCPPQDALDIYHADRENRRVQREDRHERNFQIQKTQTYLHESLYAGLTPQPSDLHKASDFHTPNFNAQDFQTLLDRCATRKIAIFYMCHQAPGSNKYDRYEHYKVGGLPFFSKKFNANAIFKTWRAQGCNGLFHAGISVRSHLVEQFMEQKKKH